MNMKIDAVITWVNGNDDNHINKINKYVKIKEKINSQGFRTRYDQVEEIKYCVNSIIKYASFIRNIYIVTDNQIPEFCKNKKEGEYENVFIVDHKTVFGGDSHNLPVFNSRAIETKLYKTPNLSEHFIYFNDDMFLLKKVKISDFFIDNKPVIRGSWKKFNEDIFYKPSVNSPKQLKRTSHKKAQEKGAKILGYKKFFKFHHIPSPLRKSTIEKFLTQNRELEVSNIKHKFRSTEQFIIQGLANHIEIKNNTCILKKDYQLVFFKNYKKPFFWIKFKLNRISKRKNKLFLNMQSLDQCPNDKLAFILNWLKERYK